MISTIDFIVVKEVGIMNISYIEANPSGNRTVFVLSQVEKNRHTAIATKLLQTVCKDAEQVGYLQLAENKPIRVDMMGGEFCGNASRSAAAYAVMAARKDVGVYEVTCSGCDSVLTAHVSKKDDHTYYADVDMPLPLSIEAVLLDVQGMPSRFFRVALPGIVHFVHFVDTIEGIDKNVFWEALREYVADEVLEAYGLILFSPRQLQMVPAVYVTETNTLYWENSCGSGSAAVAATLAIMGKKRVACTIQQPGGSIHIAADVQEETIRSIRIGGPVDFSAPQCIDL